MKQASIMLHLSKETCFAKHNVTPVEAMYLVASHHVNKGDNPVIVDVKTITDIADKRSNNQECDRLRSTYGAKFTATISQVRDLPETFDQAIERGLKLAVPTSSLSSSGAGVASSTKII